MQLGKLMVAALALIFAAPSFSQQVTFEDAMARYSPAEKDRYMYTVWVKLTLNAASHQLTIKSKERPLDVKYDDIREVIFDPHYHYVYLGYRKANGSTEPYMLWVEPEVWDKVVDSFKGAFGSRVTITEVRVGEKIERSALRNDKSSFKVTVDKKNRPMPVTKSDKALIVVVCLPFHYRATGQGKEIMLHANDAVIAAYKMGTYAFAYLDPGEYVLAAETDHSNALKVKVEAGRGYYFIQDTKVGFRAYTAELSQYPEQMVMYEVTGAYYADWKIDK
jgi:hypothetical protein